jgi:hypothetical protein
VLGISLGGAEGLVMTLESAISSVSLRTGRHTPCRDVARLHHCNGCWTAEGEADVVSVAVLLTELIDTADTPVPAIRYGKVCANRRVILQGFWTLYCAVQL